jgi:hypothetical protein
MKTRTAAPGTRREAQAPDLVAAATAGIDPYSARKRREIYAAFAQHLIGPSASAEDGLRALVGMGPGPARAAIDGFRAHELERGIAETTAGMRATAVRTAVRKAGLDINKPVGPELLVATATAGMTRLSARVYRSVCRAFAKYLIGPSAEAEDGLRALANAPPGRAAALLDGFRGHELAHGVSAHRAAERADIVRRAAGRAGVDAGGRTPRVPIDAGPLVGAALAGVSRDSTPTYLSTFRAFAYYRGAPSAEAALGELVSADPGRAAALLDGFRGHELAHGRKRWTARGRTAQLRTAVRKARAAVPKPIVRPRAADLADVGQAEPAALVPVVLRLPGGSYLVFDGREDSDQHWHVERLGARGRKQRALIDALIGAGTAGLGTAKLKLIACDYLGTLGRITGLNERWRWAIERPGGPGKRADRWRIRHVPKGGPASHPPSFTSAT